MASEGAQLHLQPRGQLPHGWDPKSFASGSRLAAAMAVVKQRSPWRAVGALVFRVLELSAQALLPAVMIWVVEPAAMGVFFMLFWYLPSAWHVSSYKKPFAFPLLAFVVDDFSILGLHPTPRNAKKMYRIMVVRVALLLAVVPLSYGPISPLPAWVRLFFFDQDVWNAFKAQLKHGQIHHQGSEGEMGIVFLWLALFASVIVLSALWLFIALHMLFISTCQGRKSPIVGEVSRDFVKVQELAAQVDETKNLNDEECHEALLRLKQRYPAFMLTNVFNTCGPAMGFLSRLVTEAYSIGLFVMAAITTYEGKHPNYMNNAARQTFLASVLGVTLAVTLVQLGMHHPETIIREVRRSWARGVHTEGYLAIVRADKGAQAVPALFVKIYGLPFAATTAFSVIVSWVSILGVIGVVSLFTFQQFDLGVEAEGMEETSLINGRDDSGRSGENQDARELSTLSSSFGEGKASKDA